MNRNRKSYSLPSYEELTDIDFSIMEKNRLWISANQINGGNDDISLNYELNRDDILTLIAFLRSAID